MRIFEYPYVIISITVICFFLLGGIGIYFAVRGLKTANDEEEYDFTNISKLESSFAKSGKRRENRCVMYISVFLDNYRSLYSESQTEKVFLAIRRILLDSFQQIQRTPLQLMVNIPMLFILLLTLTAYEAKLRASKRF